MRLSDEQIAGICSELAEDNLRELHLKIVVKNLLADREAREAELHESSSQLANLVVLTEKDKAELQAELAAVVAIANTVPDYENELRLRDAEIVELASRYGWSPENPKSPVRFIEDELAACRAELAGAKRDVENLGFVAKKLDGEA